MKKLLSLLFAAILPVMASAYNAYIDGIYYNLNGETKEAEVTNRNGNPNSYSVSSINIPMNIVYNGVNYSVTSIGYAAFEDCSGLTSIMIPNNVTRIRDNAFQNCSNLTSVIIPINVISIGNSAFNKCSSMTSVTIPNSVISIGHGAFGECEGMVNINVESGNTVFDSRNNCNAIIETKTNTLIIGCKNTIIPNDVTQIGYFSFYNCKSLTSISIPNSVTKIGECAFLGCSGLTSVIIPNSVTSIGNSAFSGCSGLTSVLIPNSLKSIGGLAFSGCSGLTSITIPNSVTSIGDRAFQGCESLMTVNSYIREPFNVKALFNEETYRNGTLYVPAGTKDLYIRFDGWREFLNIVEMGEEPAPNGQCAKPSIIFAGKEMRYECETPGAEFESILTTEEQRFTGNKLVMENKDLVYILTVYATAPGYDRSEPAQVKFIVNRNDVNQDGTVDVADIATIIDAMAGKSREEGEE